MEEESVGYRIPCQGLERIVRLRVSISTKSIINRSASMKSLGKVFGFMLVLASLSSVLGDPRGYPHSRRRD